MRRIYSVGQTARACGTTPRTILQWVEAGRLRGYVIPGSQERRFPADAILPLLAELGLGPSALEEAEPLGQRLSRMRAMLSAPHVPGEGPEALEWLRGNANPECFRRDRFSSRDGSTREAIRFVERLYALGAERVVIPPLTIDHDGGPFPGELWAYAEVLAVVLPAGGPQREALIWLCANERIRCHDRHDFGDPERMVGCRVVELAW